VELIKGLFSNNACEFGYRDSIFKHGVRDKYIVTHVVFRLQKKGDLHLDYGNVKEEFSKSGRQTLQGLRDTIIAIRSQKLPDPKKIGNAGSFFKNPLISNDTFHILNSKFDTIPHYPSTKEKVKIPAAWLIEKAGWKGVREGDVGTWPLQALVIVNYGNATGQELFNFSEKIRTSVKEQFDIILEREVKIVEEFRV
jgi:UDP-N-acetylmuramate dehydrogenase